jgi:non-homologous end joining protein Ku
MFVMGGGRVVAAMRDVTIVLGACPMGLVMNSLRFAHNANSCQSFGGIPVMTSPSPE